MNVRQLFFNDKSILNVCFVIIMFMLYRSGQTGGGHLHDSAQRQSNIQVEQKIANLIFKWREALNTLHVRGRVITCSYNNLMYW